MGAVSGSGLSLGTLWVAIAANVDQALTEFQKFTNDLGKLIDKQKEKWEGLATVGDSLTKVGTALTVGITAPLVALGVAASKTAGDFESAMNKVQAVSDATGADMDAMRQQAIKLGADTKFSAQEAAEGMGALAAAGLNTNQVMAAMPGVLDLAAAGELSVQRAAEVTAETLGQFGLAADQAGKVADVLAKGAASSAVTVEDLAQSMKLVGPIAHQVGMNLTDTTTALALLGNAGLKATEAGTGLRGVIASLEAPSKKAQTALDALGITVNDASGKMLPLDNIMKQLAESGASTGEMFKIFGRESSAAAAILKDKAGPAWAAMTEEMNKSEGAAKKMADTLMRGLKGSLENLKGSVETLLIQLGTGLNPALEALIKVGTQLVNNFLMPAVTWFSNLSEPVRNAIIAFAAMAAAIGPVILGIGLFITSIGTLLPALGGMAQALGLASAGALGPFGIALAAAAAAAVAAATMIYTHWDDFAGKFLGIILQLTEALRDFVKNAATLIPTAGMKDWVKELNGEIMGLVKSQNEHFQALAKNNAAQAEAVKKAQEQKAAAEALQKQIEEQRKKIDELTKAHGALAGSVEETGKKSKEATDKIKGLTDKSEILRAMAQQLQSEHNKLVNELARFYLAVDRVIDPTKNLGDMIETLGKVTKGTDAKLFDMAETLTKKMPPAMKAILEAGSIAGGAETAMRDLGITSEKAMQKIADGARDSYTAVKNNPNATEWEKQAAEAKALEAQIGLLITKGQAYSAEAELMRQKLEAIRTSLKNQADGVTSLTQAYHDLGLQAPAEVEKLAIKAKAAYEAIAESAGENSMQAQRAWIQATEATYAAIIANGGILTEQQKADLDRARTNLDNHLGTTKSQWQTAYDSIHDTVMRTFNDLEDKLITGKGSFSEILTNMWQGLAKAALDYFLNPIKKAISEFIAETIADLLSGKGLGGIVDALKSIGKAVGDVFSGAGAAGQTAGAATSTIGSASSTASTVASTALSSVTGIVGAVGGVVSAVSGVISNFQMARQENTLNAIEESTRYMKIGLVTQADSLLNDSHMIRNMFSDFNKWVGDVLQTYLFNMNTALDGIESHTANALGLLDYAKQGIWNIHDFLTADSSMGPRQINITVSGSDPTAVASQLATMLRAQGAFG
jgi:TP901 family phage tail tape measure protein